MQTKPHNSKFICVQSSVYPSERLNFNEQTQAIYSHNTQTTWQRLCTAAIESLKQI